MRSTGSRPSSAVIGRHDRSRTGAAVISRKRFLTLSWILGLALFVVIIARTGQARVWESLKQLSWKSLAWLFLLRLIYWVMRTYYWKIILDSYGERPPFANLFAARIAGHALSYLTPSSHFGGEAVRALVADCRDRKKCFASIIVDTTLEILTVVLFAIVAVVMALSRVGLPGQVKFFLVAAAAAAGLAVLFILNRQRKGIFIWLLDLLVKIRIRPGILERNRDKIRQVDDHIADFMKGRRNVWVQAVGFNGLIVLFWTLEIHLTLAFLGAVKTNYLLSFMITTLGTLAFVIPAIPASLGTFELTYVGLFTLFGLSSGLAVSVTLVRRILALFWAGTGLVFVMLNNKRLSSQGR